MENNHIDQKDDISDNTIYHFKNFILDDDDCDDDEEEHKVKYTFNSDFIIKNKNDNNIKNRLYKFGTNSDSDYQTNSKVYLAIKQKKDKKNEYVTKRHEVIDYIKNN